MFKMNKRKTNMNKQDPFKGLNLYIYLKNKIETTQIFK